MAEPTVRGRFVWHELMTSDVAAAVTYYKKAIGWTTQPYKGDNSYLMWVAKSGPLGGVASLPEGNAAPYWLPYIGTPDIEATVRDAEKLGGKVLVPVTTISDAGSYAVLADPQGASFGVYGTQDANASSGNGMPQPGEFSWHELPTNDYKAAFAFYEALFGWEKTGEHDMGQWGIYFMFGFNGQSIGGMFNKDPHMPIAWCSYTQVADATKTAKTASKAGGKVINGPMEVPGGSWIAQILDPQGAMHAVVSNAVMAAAATPAKTEASNVKSAAASVNKKKAAVKKKSAKKKLAAKAKRPVVKAKKATKKKVAVKKAAKKSGKKASKRLAPKPMPKKKASKKKLAQKTARGKAKVAKKAPAAKRRKTAKRKK
ncbi:MAG: VOC family protein [Steroidobacteraceae bacterium]